MDRKHVEATPATDLVVFSRGVDITSDGRVLELSMASKARVEAALAYVAVHLDAFVARRDTGEPGRIVFTGGWAAAAGCLPPSPARHREGRLMDELAHELGVHGLALGALVDTFAETESTSTLENVLQIVDAGFLADRTYTAKSPLGLVAHPGHMPRVEWFTRRVLGLEPSAIRHVFASGDDRRSRNLPEPILYALTRAACIGATTPHTLASREHVVLASARLLRLPRWTRRSPI